MIIYLIIGLPASGKTTLLNKIKRCHKIDDIKNVKELPAIPVKRLAIADPNFCFSDVLDKAEMVLTSKYPYSRILKIYFENNPKKALCNAKKRKNKKVDYFINVLTKSYVIPTGFKPLEIKN